MTTNIEWVQNPDGSKGETWPVVTGCTPVSEGCRNCYAARMAATRLRYHPRYEGLATIKDGKAKWTGEVRLNHDVLEQPLHWKKPRMVFVASMGDLFHEDVLEQFIFRILKITRDTPQHTYQILTKRPGRMAPVMCEYYARLRAAYGSKAEEPQQNLWLGVSIENQAAADERIPFLLQIPAAVHYVSVEPTLSAVDLTKVRVSSMEILNALTGKSAVPHSEPPKYRSLNWVICGGESGPGARPMRPDWARSLRDQCQAAGIPYFFKQWGAFRQAEPGDKVDYMFEYDWYGDQLPVTMTRIGKKRAGHLLDGRTWQEFPR